MPDKGVLSTHYLQPWLPLKGFKAYRIQHGAPAAVSFARRDLFQIYLMTSRVCYSGEETDDTGHVLVFSSPNGASCWASNFVTREGYTCLFTREFLGKHPRLMNLLQSPLAGVGDIAVYPVNQAQANSMATLFGQILFAQSSDYVFKHELIANCLFLLGHEALKMQPSPTGYGF